LKPISTETKVTDLKAANQMLAQAIQALESPEHDADVSEAEAIRNRLLDLDAAIGDRIQAKLDAHRLIVDSWGVSEAIIPRRLDMADEPIVEITDPLAAFDADAWEAHHAEHTGQYALSGDEVPDAVLMNGAAESVAEIQQDQ
jgi:hypothetical protein